MLTFFPYITFVFSWLFQVAFFKKTNKPCLSYHLLNLNFFFLVFALCGIPSGKCWLSFDLLLAYLYFPTVCLFCLWFYFLWEISSSLFFFSIRFFKNLDLISNFDELLFFDHSFFIVICAVLWMKYPLYICLKFHFRFLHYFCFLWSRFLLLQSFWCQWLSSNVWWSLVICLYIKWVTDFINSLLCG